MPSTTRSSSPGTCTGTMRGSCFTGSASMSPLTPTHASSASTTFAQTSARCLHAWGRPRHWRAKATARVGAAAARRGRGAAVASAWDEEARATGSWTGCRGGGGNRRLHQPAHY